jgi:hypothetical protein
VPWHHDSNYPILEYFWAIDIFVRLIRVGAMTSWFKLSHIGIFLGHRYFRKINQSRAMTSWFKLSHLGIFLRHRYFCKIKQSLCHYVIRVGAMTSWFKLSHLGIFLGHRYFCKINQSRDRCIIKVGPLRDQSRCHDIMIQIIPSWNISGDIDIFVRLIRVGAVT